MALHCVFSQFALNASLRNLVVSFAVPVCHFFYHFFTGVFRIERPVRGGRRRFLRRVRNLLRSWRRMVVVQIARDSSIARATRRTLEMSNLAFAAASVCFVANGDRFFGRQRVKKRTIWRAIITSVCFYCSCLRHSVRKICCCLARLSIFS